MAKTKRVALSKKMRFEVFKRDSFKCQYCGRSAPEVVLHVDHIQPVAKDGTNDIFNLITSCADCNGGKGARELSSQEALNKSKKQLDELNEKREQLEMMMEWQKELQSYKKNLIALLEKKFKESIGDWFSFNTTDRSSLSRMIDEFGIDEIMTSIDIAISNNKLKKNFAPYLYGILRIRKIDIQDPVMSAIYHAYNSAKKKYYDEMYNVLKQFNTERDFKQFFFQHCKEYIEEGNKPEELLAIVAMCKNYQSFFNELFGGTNG